MWINRTLLLTSYNLNATVSAAVNSTINATTPLANATATAATKKTLSNGAITGISVGVVAFLVLGLHRVLLSLLQLCFYGSSLGMSYFFGSWTTFGECGTWSTFMDTLYISGGDGPFDIGGFDSGGFDGGGGGA